MNREQLKNISQETVSICERGIYHYDNKHNNIKKSVEGMIKNTILYNPKELNQLRQKSFSKKYNTTIEVKEETTLQGCERLKEHNPVVLNFASAKNPGGGFLKGSKAQEESLARTTGLYLSLISQQKMYDYNRSIKGGLYSDYLIYSPNVPVIRDNNLKLLNKPFEVSFISTPAINKGVLKQEHLVHETMKRRIRNILSIALEKEHDTIILGAYGCGVFKNNPRDVAKYFKSILLENRYKNKFKHIRFSIVDNTKDKNILNSFKQEMRF